MAEHWQLLPHFSPHLSACCFCHYFFSYYSKRSHDAMSHLHQIFFHFSGHAKMKVTETAVPPANLALAWNMALLINILNSSVFKRSFSLLLTIQGFCITYSHMMSVMFLQSLKMTEHTPRIYFFTSCVNSAWAKVLMLWCLLIIMKSKQDDCMFLLPLCCVCLTLKRVE